jgi:hypothetical protein
MKMKKKAKNYQSLFENKKLTKMEQRWCLAYEGATLFEPIYTEDVKDKKTFIEMIRKNHTWLECHISDATRSSERAMRQLPYYEKIVYQL